MRYSQRAIVVCILLLLIILLFVIRIQDYCTFNELKTHRFEIKDFIYSHGFVAPLLLISLNVLFIAVAIPIGGFFPIAFGFLFSPLYAISFAVAGAFFGSLAAFLVAKYVFTDYFRSRFSNAAGKMELKFSENPFWTVLTLRFVPIVPFVFMNIMPALANVRTRIFAIACLIGTIPPSILFSMAGGGLDQVFEVEGSVTMLSLMNKELMFSMIGLSCLFLVPLLIRAVISERG